MDEQIVKKLKNRRYDEGVKRLEETCAGFVQLSTSWMTRYYEGWEDAYRAYRAEVKTVKSRERQNKQGHPDSRVPLPTLLAQVETLKTFFSEMFTQEETFFSVVATKAQDIDGARLANALLDRDLNKCKFRGVVLPKLLKDAVITNICVLYATWKEDRAKVMVEREVLDEVGDGTQIPRIEVVEEEQLLDQYNFVRAISPYHVLPDPRIPLDRYQEGEFCGIEDVYSRKELKRLEAKGLVTNIDDVDPGFNSDMLSMRSKRKDFGAMSSAWKDVHNAGNRNIETPVVVTELQVRMKGSKYGLPGDNEELWLIWLANDKTVIRAEPMNYVHDMFTIIIATLNVATDVYIEQSIAAPVLAMQDTVNYLLNGRLSNLRQNIRGKMVVDESVVNMADLMDPDKSYIRLRNSAGGLSTESWIKPVPVQDIGAQLIPDIEKLDAWMKSTTGATDNLLGNISTGRRTATEMRSAIANSTSRLKQPAVALWESGFSVLGKQMLENHRAGLELEIMVKLVGADPDYMSSIGTFSVVRKDLLPSSYDFKIVDNVSPSEKIVQASQLRELLTVLLSQPQLIQLFNVNLQAVILDLLKLQGLKHVSRYFGLIQPPTAGAPALGQGVAPTPGDPAAASGAGAGLGPVNPLGGVANAVGANS